MTTILVRTVIDLIKLILEDSKEQSIVADKSWYKGPFRDTENSAGQRAIANYILDELRGFELKKSEDGSLSDKESLEVIKGIIRKANLAVEKLRKDKGWEDGKFNATLNAINTNIDKFLDNLLALDFKFIDVPEGDEPFSIFCTYALYYLGEHIMCPPKDSPFGKMVRFFWTTITGDTAVTIRQQKEACVLAHLQTCAEDMEVMTEDSSKAKTVRKRHVLKEIQATLEANEKICSESKPIQTIPLSLMLGASLQVKAPTMKPSRGRLRIALENAKEEIEGRCLTVEASEAASAKRATASKDAQVKRVATLQKMGGFTYGKGPAQAVQTLAKAVPPKIVPSEKTETEITIDGDQETSIDSDAPPPPSPTGAKFFKGQALTIDDKHKPVEDADADLEINVEI